MKLTPIRSWQTIVLVYVALLATLVQANGIGGVKRLYTSSVAYCSAPIAILVTDLSLRFYPGNSTLEFDLSAASIQDNLNVSIALSVNAYGLGIFDVNIDLCSLAGGILCPLPQYQFSGGGIFPVPTQFASEIPDIAFNIPDLEAVATLQLTNSGSNANNEVVGCVQATLSNGHTARQSGVLWATVGLALLALFSSLLHTAIAQSIGAAQWRIVDVMWAIQLPAIASLLSLNYPTVFLEYGTNFAWSIGLINIPSLQSSITKTRANTGGHDTAVFGKNLTAQLGRKYNPFSDSGQSSTTGVGRSVSIGSLGFYSLPDAAGEQAKNAATKLSAQPLSSYATISKELVKRQQYAPNTGPGGSLLTGGSGVALPLVTGNASINGGIGTFAERNDVAPSNAFLTVLVSMMILLAILSAAVLLVYIVALIVRMSTSFFSRRKRMTANLSHWSHRVNKPSEFFNTVVLATLARYLHIVFPIFFIFAFWQWVAGDSWVGDLVAALMTVVMLAFAAAFYVPLIVIARRGSPTDLFHDKDIGPAHGTKKAKRWGHLAHPFKPAAYWFAITFLGCSILRACFISFAQDHGTRQAIGLLVVEVLLFVSLCVLRVGRDKKSDFVFLLLCFSRIAAWAVCIAFIPSANVRTIPRAIVGYVLLVVTALPIVFLFFLTLWDLFTPFLKKNRRDVRRSNVVEKDAYDNTVSGHDNGLHHADSSDDFHQANAARSNSHTTIDDDHLQHRIV